MRAGVNRYYRSIPLRPFIVAVLRRSLADGQPALVPVYYARALVLRGLIEEVEPGQYRVVEGREPWLDLPTLGGLKCGPRLLADGSPRVPPGEGRKRKNQEE